MADGQGGVFAEVTSKHRPVRRMTRDAYLALPVAELADTRVRWYTLANAERLYLSGHEVALFLSSAPAMAMRGPSTPDERAQFAALMGDAS